MILSQLTTHTLRVVPNPAHRPLPSSTGIYFFAELIKLAVSLLWCASRGLADRSFAARLRFSQRDCWQYAIPGFTFFVQNYLGFFALQHMSASAYQLLMNTRIIVVALLAVALQQTRLNTAQWLGLGLLMNGAMQYQLSSCDRVLRISPEGLGIIAIIVICAAGGNVVTQLVMQKDSGQPLMMQNAILYLWGIVFNGVNWLRSVTGPTPQAWFGDIGGIQVLAMAFYACYGLSISIILKNFGAITRTIIQTLAIFMTTGLDVLVFNEQVGFLEVSCFCTVLASTYLYSEVARHYHPETHQHAD